MKHSGQFKPAGLEPRRGNGGRRPGAGRPSKEKLAIREEVKRLVRVELEKHVMAVIGYHEPLSSYFECVLSSQWLNPTTRRMEDRSNVVIAYRSIIEFYLKELHAAEGPVIRVEQPVRYNRHGGHRQGAGRKKVYATHAEKVHEYRKRKKRVTVYTKSSL